MEGETLESCGTAMLIGLFPGRRITTSVMVRIVDGQ